LKDYKAYSWYGLFAPAGTRKEIDRPDGGRHRAGAERACRQGPAR
jgi:hypothetical protein